MSHCNVGLFGRCIWKCPNAHCVIFEEARRKQKAQAVTSNVLLYRKVKVWLTLGYFQFFQQVFSVQMVHCNSEMYKRVSELWFWYHIFLHSMCPVCSFLFQTVLPRDIFLCGQYMCINLQNYLFLITLLLITYLSQYCWCSQHVLLRAMFSYIWFNFFHSQEKDVNKNRSTDSFIPANVYQHIFRIYIFD